MSVPAPGRGRASARLPESRTVPGSASPVALPLAVVGCDFRIASSAWRTCLLLSPAERADLTAALRASCGAGGLVVLETCNRVEWIVAAAAPQWAAEVMRAQMVERWLQPGAPEAASRRDLPVPYLYTGRSAVQHLLRVAVGLESFVLGEREIAGQLHRALVTARSEGHASPYHNALQTALGRTVRKVQRLTHWRNPVRGVHGLALDVLNQTLPVADADVRSGGKRTVLVVGMGEIGRKTAGLLAGAGGWRVLRFNRSQRDRHDGWLPLPELTAHLDQADALVVATGAPQPCVDLRPLLASRPRPLVVVDLGAPAQVALSPGQPAVYLGLDALMARPQAQPEGDLAAVHELVQEGVREFLVETQKRELAGLLRAAHDAYDRLSYQALPALLRMELADLDTDRRVRLELALRELLRGQTRDIVHEIEAAAANRAGEG